MPDSSSVPTLILEKMGSEIFFYENCSGKSALMRILFGKNLQVNKVQLFCFQYLKNSIFFSANCKKLLDSGSITEHDGEMFCSSCYRKNFGPKGYGFGGGAGCLSMDDGKGYTVKFINYLYKN